MRYNPEEAGKEKMLEHYPGLKRYKPLKVKFKKYDTDKIIRFVLYLTDFESPLNEIVEETDRRIQAAEMAGMSADSEEVLELIELDGVTPDGAKVHNIIDCFFVMFNNSLYQQWFTDRQAYRQLSKSIWRKSEKSQDLNSKITAHKNLKPLLSEIRQLETRLFPNQTTREVIEETTAKKIINYAEEYAEDSGVV